MQLVGQQQPLNGFDCKVLTGVLGALGGLTAQDHFRMADEVAVDGKTVLVYAQMHPIRFLDNGPVPFLQENDIGDDLCTGVGLESVVGQTDRPQQVSPLRQITPHSGILGVQRIAAGDEGHNAAGTHPVQCFGEEIVVDRKVEPAVLRVIYGILPKGYIADGEVEEVLGEAGILVALYSDVRLGIELLGDAPGNAVQFHAVEL